MLPNPTMETKPILDFVFPKSKADLELNIITPENITSSVLHLLHECVDNYFDARLVQFNASKIVYKLL